jgi:hypothetical protein
MPLDARNLSLPPFPGKPKGGVWSDCLAPDYDKVHPDVLVLSFVDRVDFSLIPESVLFQERVALTFDKPMKHLRRADVDLPSLPSGLHSCGE